MRQPPGELADELDDPRRSRGTEPMSGDRVTEIRVKNMRVIDHVSLRLDGLTVLIGDNGTGKSTLLEAIELLRQAAKPAVDFVNDVLVGGHGGRDLLRQGRKTLGLWVAIEGKGEDRLEYDFIVQLVGTSLEINLEQLQNVDASGKRVRQLQRWQDRAQFVDDTGSVLLSEKVSVDPGTLAIASFGSVGAPPVYRRVLDALENLDVHVPFETRPLWQQRELEIRSGPRWPPLLQPTRRLSRYGDNLANCFHELRERGGNVWRRVIERAQLGLGDDLREFKLTPAGRGEIELEVLFGRAPDDPLPAASLSDGQLSYLAFLALVELSRDRSLLAFDEPEADLHPALLSRVVWYLEELSESCPVIVATHSDRFLDSLANPAQSVVLCDLDGKGATVLRRPDPAQLTHWLEDYRGIGSLRSEGYEEHIFGQPEEVPDEPESGE